MRVWEVVWVTKIFPLHSTDERMLGNVTVNSATAMRNAKCDIQRTRVIKGGEKLGNVSLVTSDKKVLGDRASLCYAFNW